MEEIKIAPAKFWVIAAYKPGNGGFIIMRDGCSVHTYRRR